MMVVKKYKFQLLLNSIVLVQFAYRYPVVSAPLIEKPVLSPLNSLGNVFIVQLAIEKWVYFWTQNFIP